MKNLLSNEKEQFNLPFSSFYFVDKPIHGPNKKLLRVCFGTRHRKSMTVKKNTTQVCLVKLRRSALYKVTISSKKSGLLGFARIFTFLLFFIN